MMRQRARGERPPGEGGGDDLQRAVGGCGPIEHKATPPANQSGSSPRAVSTHAVLAAY
jgi:hypothetical protein